MRLQCDSNAHSVCSYYRKYEALLQVGVVSAPETLVLLLVLVLVLVLLKTVV